MKDEWIDVWMNKCMGRFVMDGQIYRWTSSQMAGCTCRWMMDLIDCIGGWLDAVLDGWIDVCMCGWIGDWVDGWIDKCF